MNKNYQKPEVEAISLDLMECITDETGVGDTSNDYGDVEI